MSKWDERITYAVEAQLFPQVYHRVLFFGLHRAGKSTLAEKLFHGNCEIVPCHKEMTVDDLIGGMTLINGSTLWQDGAALRALRNGRVLILNEVDHGVRSAECTSYFHALLDDPASVTIPTGERINAAPGYAVIGTSNALPSELPPPIFDRFDAIFKVTTLSDGLVRALGPYAKQAIVAADREAKKYSSWTRPASVNLWLAASKLKNHGVTEEKIAEVLGLSDQEKNDFLIAIATQE